jgi:hypothetical protein
VGNKIGKSTMRNLLLASTTGILLAISAFGANASSLASDAHFATALPACYSKTSPILDSHYGYDDRACANKMTEGRAAYEDGATNR